MANKSKSKKSPAVSPAEEVPAVSPVVEVPALSPEEQEEEEIRLAMERIRGIKAKQAQRKADGEIEELRKKRGELIQNQIEILQGKIEELTGKIHELDQEAGEVERGERDGELTAGIVAKASEIQLTTKNEVKKVPVEGGGEKRERNSKTRPPLGELIHSRVDFRFNHKGKTYFCETEDGVNFHKQNGEKTKSLASWTVEVIAENGGGGRKVSAYEVVEAKISPASGWELWGKIYHEETTGIN